MDKEETRDFLQGKSLNEIREKIADGNLNQLTEEQLVAAIITDEPDEYPESARKAWPIIKNTVRGQNTQRTGLTNKEYTKLFNKLEKITEQGKAKTGRILAAIQLFKSLC